MLFKKKIIKYLCFFIPFTKVRKRVRKKLFFLSLKSIFEKKIKYDFIFSMGSACFVADILKEMNLRTASGPFDWCYGATFEQRFNIFLNKFQNFFDKKDLNFVGVDNKTKIDVYNNSLTGINFNHDFSLGGNFETEYLSISEKYNRRINRLITKINEGSRILIVYAEMRETQPTSIEKISSLLSQANNIYQNKIDLLYLKNNTNLKPEQCKMIVKDKHLKVYEYLGSYGGNISKYKKNEAIKIMKTMWSILSFAKNKKE